MKSYFSDFALNEYEHVIKQGLYASSNKIPLRF